MARSTWRGVTGRDCSSHRLLPSSEILGAVTVHMAAIKQSPSSRRSGRKSPRPGMDSSGVRLSRLTIRKTAATGAMMTPRALLRI